MGGDQSAPGVVNERFGDGELCARVEKLLPDFNALFMLLFVSGGEGGNFLGGGNRFGGDSENGGLVLG